MGSWWAAFWFPGDVPGLELIVLAWDKALTDPGRVARLLPLLDRYGLTPYGRHQLRWLPPAVAAPAAEEDDELVKRRAARRARFDNQGAS